MHFYKFFILLSILFSSFTFAQIQWDQIPGPQKANIQHVVTFTSNGEDEILAVVDGVFWHSTDYGDTWQSGASGIVGSFRSFKVAGENTAFALTSAGVFRSIDRGWSWNMLPSPPSSLSEIKSIAPEDSNTMYLAALNGLFRYREISGGVWEQITSPLSDFMNAVAVEFTRNGMLWVAVLNGANVDLFSSSDSGTVFNSLIINVGGIGGPRGVSISSSKSGKLALRIEKENSETFYLNGIVLGNSWIKLNAPGGSDRAFLTYAYWMTDNTLYFNSGRSRANFAYVYSQLKSDDNGNTWEEYNNSLDQGITKIMHRSLSGRLYAGKRKGWNGIQMSEDDGLNWQSIGPVTEDVLLKNIHVNRQGIITGNATSDLVGRSELTAGIYDPAGLWKPVYIPFDHPAQSSIMYFRMHENMELFVAYNGAGFPGDERGIRSSGNSGISWQGVSSGIFDPPKEMFELNTGSILLRGGSDLYGYHLLRKDVMSVDWSRRASSRGLLRLVYEDTDLAVAAKQFAGSGSILASMDDGLTWLEKDTPGNEIYDVLMTFADHIVVSTDSGVFRSEDMGDTWLDWSQGIGATRLLSFNKNNNGIIAALDTSQQIYYTDEEVGTWQFLVNELSSSDTAHVFIDDSNYIYFARSGVDSLLFKSANPINITSIGNTDPPSPVISKFELLSNYPNPFNPSTQIPILLQEDTELRVAVYDLLGRKIATLFAGTASAGEIEVTWDGRNSEGVEVQSGIYIVRVTSGAVEKSRKMVLLR